MKKRLFSLLLTICMALSVLSVSAMAEVLLISPNPSASRMLLPRVRTYEEQLTDAAGAWCADAIQTVYETGLMEGRTTDRFDYESNLTYAQITVIAARLYELLTGGDGSIDPKENADWWQSSYDLLASVGILSTNADFSSPAKLWWYPHDANTPCPRSFFVELLGTALHVSGTSLPVIHDITLIPDLLGDPTGYIHQFYNAGIVGGSDIYGSFHANDPLTRGAAAAILARIVVPSQRLTEDLVSFDYCRDILNMDPAAVLLIVDGTEITAEQFALFCAAPLKHQDVVPALTYAKSQLLQSMAVRALAKENGEVPSAAQLDQVRQEAAALTGYLGLSADSWYWQKETALYHGALSSAFLETYGDKAYPSEMEKALQSHISNMKVEQTRVYDIHIVWPWAKEKSASAPVVWG